MAPNPPRFAALAAVCFALLATPSAAQEAQTTIVLDASGSMWGRLDGTPKIAVAREAIRSMLEDWDGDRAIGLVAYGHRRDGDCGDIETLVAPGPLDRDGFMAAVEGIDPKGKTPLTAAVRRAAQDMAYADRPASVILVSDGIETCDADPCSVAGTLERTGTAFTAHVIGFGVEEADTAGLACIAEATGGLYLAAADAKELAAAFNTAATASDPTPAADPAASDDFAGEELGERWRVINPDPAAFIVDGSNLITITTVPTAIGQENQTNVFVWQGQPLPDGDWDVSIDFTSEFTWAGGLIEVALYEDPQNFVSARLRGDNSSNNTLHLGIKSVVRGDVTTERVRFASDSCCPRRYDMDEVYAALKESGGTLTLTKRGREYSARIETRGWVPREGQDNPLVAGPITVLRASGDPAIFSGTRARRFGDLEQVSTEIDRFAITPR